MTDKDYSEVEFTGTLDALTVGAPPSEAPTNELQSETPSAKMESVENPLHVEGIKSDIPTKEAVSAMEPEQIEELVRRVIAENQPTGDLIDKAKITLMVQEQVKKILNPNPGPVIFVQTNDPWAGFKEGEKRVPEKSSDQLYRYGNSRADSLARRRSQGYEPALDGSGKEIRVGDMVLLKIGRGRHAETIEKPLQMRREQRKHSVHDIAQQFHEFGRSQGVKTEGDIKYDAKE